jgi:hypothetical protein
MEQTEKVAFLQNKYGVCWMDHIEEVNAQQSAHWTANIVRRFKQLAFLVFHSRRESNKG